MRPVYDLTRVSITLAILMAGPPILRAVQAQERSPSFSSLRYPGPPDSPTRLQPSIPGQAGDSIVKRESYWLEGGLILGIGTGLLAAVLAGGLCNDADSGGGGGPCWDNTLLGGVTGFGAGFSLGALLGGQLHKPERAPPDSAATR